MGDRQGHDFHGNQYVTDPSGIAKSLNQAERDTQAHREKWRERGAAVPVGTKLRAKRKDYTLTEVAGDRFWIPEKGKAIADTAALVEFGEPWKALVESQTTEHTGLTHDGKLKD